MLSLADGRAERERSSMVSPEFSDAGHGYEKRAKHTICVKVVDVFGCDTSITAEVKV